jgi:hypothetical protein
MRREIPIRQRRKVQSPGAKFEFLSDTEIMEDVSENEKDAAHALGK